MIVNTNFLMYSVNYIIVLTFPITKPYSLLLLSFTLFKKKTLLCPGAVFLIWCSRLRRTLRKRLF